MSRIIPAIQTGVTVNDLNTASVSWRSYNVQAFDYIAAQVFSVGAAWPAGVQVDLEKSLDGITWSAFASPQTYTANGLQAKVDVQGDVLVRARVSTSSSSGTIRVILSGDNTNS